MELRQWLASRLIRTRLPNLNATCVFLTAILAVPVLSIGQSSDRFLENRGLNSPTLQLDFPVPVSTVRSLRLLKTQNDLMLLSAGDDRVVHWWKIVFKNGRPDHLVLLQTLRWPIARGQGQILALDAKVVSKNQFRIVLGGNGLYPSRAVLFESDNIQSPEVLDPPDLGAVHQKVFSIKFHPTRSELVAIGYGGDPAKADAKVILWKIDSSGSRRLLTLSTGLGNSDAIAFNRDGTLLGVCDYDSGALREWKLSLGDKPSATPGKIVSTGTALRGIVWNEPDGWNVATTTHGLIDPASVDFDKFTVVNRTNQQVTLDDQKSKKRITLSPSQRTVLGQTKIQLSTKDLKSLPLSLGTLQGQVHVLDIRQHDSQLVFGIPAITTAVDSSSEGLSSITARLGLIFAGYQQPSEAAVRNQVSGMETILSPSDIADAVRTASISDDGRFAALAARRRISDSGLAVGTIYLFDAETGEQLLAAPDISARHVSTRKISLLRLNESSDDEAESVSIGFDGQVGNVVKVEDLSLEVANYSRLALSDIELNSPSTIVNKPLAPSQKWLYGRDGDIDVLARIGDGMKSHYRIPYRADFGAPTAAVEFTVDSRRSLVVGYQFGAVAVWDPGVSQFVRQFYGHDGAVLALDVSSDGQLLVSGGEDGVLRGWPLQGATGYSASERSDKNNNELGLEVSRMGDTIAVTDVKPGWPGFFAGFRPGDEVEDVVVVESGGARKKIPLDGLRDALLNPSPGQQILATVISENQKGKLYTNAQFEPLFELWLLSNGHWLVSTPQKFFAASNRESMRRFGWNVNIGREGVSTVRFFPMETFESDFKNSYQIARAINRRKPVQISQQVNYPSMISIESVRASEQKNMILASLDGPDDLTVEIRIAATGDEEIRTAALWCNGRKIEIPEANLAGGLQSQVNVDRSFLRKGATNLFVASVTSELNGRTLVGRDVRTIVVGNNADKTKRVDRRPRVHFVGIGVTGLDAESAFAQKDVQPLDFTGNDAWYFGAALYDRVKTASEYDTGFFGWALTTGDIAGRIDESIASEVVEPTAAGIRNLLKGLKREATADDFVCILMAGHGYSERQATGQNGFFFVTRDTDTDLNGAISGEELFTHLSGLACPIFVMIDACRSGGIKSNAEIRGTDQLSLGPEIVTSSQSGQLSYESNAIRESNGEWIGHGLFTAAGLEFLTGKRIAISKSGTRSMEDVPVDDLDFDENGELTIAELAIYLQARVPDLQRQLGLPDQNPDLLPSVTFGSGSIRFRFNGR